LAVLNDSDIPAPLAVINALAMSMNDAVVRSNDQCDNDVVSMLTNPALTNPTLTDPTPSNPTPSNPKPTTGELTGRAPTVQEPTGQASSTQPSIGQSRPGGRSVRVRAAVHRAVEELLIEQPAEALTMPVIAARAGVHPTTVYRRWGSLGDLLAEVATSRFSGDIVVPDTGSLRGDLERWASAVATDLKDPDVLALMRATVGSGPDGGCACVADRQAQLAAILDREQSRGGAAVSVDQAADTILGPLYFRAVFMGEPAEPSWARGLVDALLR
jgi:AcrR family transcriptional regulator